MTGDKLAAYRQQLAGKEAADVLAWSLAEFGSDRVILASSSASKTRCSPTC